MRHNQQVILTYLGAESDSMAPHREQEFRVFPNLAAFANFFAGKPFPTDAKVYAMEEIPDIEVVRSIHETEGKIKQHEALITSPEDAALLQRLINER